MRGKMVSPKELADVFMTLESEGAQNINLVNPTHFADGIKKALEIFRPSIPIVYNTHGYERVKKLKEMDEYVDVYLPDLKFFSPEVSNRYTGKKDYFDVASKAITFMANKPLRFDGEGMMTSGTIVRHLVLPQNVSDSKRILEWIAESGIKDKVYLDVMSQYTPFGDIKNFPELNRKLTKREYDQVLDYAISLGLDKTFYQDFSSVGEEYIPAWDY